MWSDYLQNLRGVEEWRADPYATPPVSMTMEALTDREGKQVYTGTEREEILRHEFFTPNDNDQDYQLPPAGNAPTRITDHAVERALHAQSLTIALGPDKLACSAI